MASLDAEFGWRVWMLSLDAEFGCRVWMASLNAEFGLWTWQFFELSFLLEFNSLRRISGSVDRRRNWRNRNSRALDTGCECRQLVNGYK